VTRLFAEGRDAHQEMAAKVAGVPYCEVTRQQRQSAKAINFGLVYGAGAARLQASIFDDYGIEVTLQWAQAVVNTARQSYYQLYSCRSNTRGNASAEATSVSVRGALPARSGRRAASCSLRSAAIFWFRASLPTACCER
jgi:DNA polymerase I-like protein with 3'-5' exonuclease and polymerase domains